MSSEIIKILPAEPCFSITWVLGLRCNYDCMYCPPQWHDHTSKNRLLDELKTNWISLFDQTHHHGLKYKISFAGGELTSNREFYPLVKWLRHDYEPHIKQILLTTNGSATYKYYARLLEVVDNISFSVHSEHINEQKFFDTVIKLHKTIRPGKFIHVNIMDEYWNQHRIPYYQTLLAEHNISHNVNQVDYTLQTRATPIMRGKLNLAIPNT